MSALALVCHRRGAAVTGSDRAESSYLERLRAAGIEPRIGHDAEQVPEDAEVVVSSAIPETNPELAVARRRGQRILRRGELLAELCAERRLIAVAGTHGKTTTAGMLAWIVARDGANAFFLGGELPGIGPGGEPANAGWGEGEWVIAEADESDASFLDLQPEIAVVTNVELDHHARWGSRAELSAAFRKFAEPAAELVLPADPALDPLAARAQRAALRPRAPGPAAAARGARRPQRAQRTGGACRRRARRARQRRGRSPPRSRTSRACAAARSAGAPATAPWSTTTTRITRPRSPRRWRRCASSSRGG